MFISIDLDDTLLRKDKSISSYSLNILKKCQENGHKIIINTARSKDASLELLKIIKPDYSIFNGGSQVVDQSFNTIYTDCLDGELVNKLVNELFLVSKKVTVQENLGLFTPNSPVRSEIFRDLHDGYINESYKVLASLDEEEYCKAISNRFNIKYTRYFSGSWVRFTTKSASKYSALKWLVNGDLDNVISFGDDHSDLEMLLYSKYGVCMANSQKAILDKIKLKTLSNEEDGVCVFLEQFFKWRVS